MKIQPTKTTIDFIAFAKELHEYLGRYELKKASILRYFQNINDKDMIEIVSDPYWNNYPTWRINVRWTKDEDGRYRSAPIHRDPVEGMAYGSSVSLAVKTLSIYSPFKFEIISKYGEGLFLLEATKASRTTDKIEGLRRVMESSDSRLRLKAAKELPEAEIMPLLNDRDCKVRKTVIRRLKDPKIAKEFINDISYYVRSEAYSLIGIDDLEDPVEFLMDYQKRYREYKDSNHRWWGYFTSSELKLVEHIVARLPLEDLLLFINIETPYYSANSIVAYRLGAMI